MLILVIEDDDIMLKAICKILGKNGYTAHAAKNGKEAYDFLNKNKYDLVLTDLMMPQVNGLEILSHIKTSNATLPVIIISSVGNEDMISECYKIGCSDFIRKPITQIELLLKIKKILEIKLSL